jgi:hypothetical protein
MSVHCGPGAASRFSVDEFPHRLLRRYPFLNHGLFSGTMLICWPSGLGGPRLTVPLLDSKLGVLRYPHHPAASWNLHPSIAQLKP